MTSDHSKIRQDRISRFRFSIQIREDNPATSELSKIMREANSDRASKRRTKKYMKRAWAIHLSYQMNGPGLYVDHYLRNFLAEYNSRILKGEGANLPNSFNVLNAFIEPDEDALILRLLPEKFFSLSFHNLLDCITDPNSDSSLKKIASSVENLTIYEMSMLGGFAEFKVPSSEEFVFCGAAICREGNELSIVGVFGKSNPEPKTGTIPLDKAHLYPGKEFLAKDRTEIDVSDEALFGDENFTPVILMTRIDILTEKVQVRYVFEESKEIFSVATDDPQIIGDPNVSNLFGKVGKQKETAATEMIEKLSEYAPLFEILYASPTCLSLMQHDSVTIERHPTKLRLENGKKAARFVTSNLPLFERPQYVNVSTLYTLGGELSAYKLPSTELTVETSGFWRTLPLGTVGRDKTGQPIQGKTWVTLQKSWFEGNSSVIDSTTQTIIETPSSADNVGEIYVMRSPQHQRDLYKIGYTTKSADERSKQLGSTTGQPDSFSVVQSWTVRAPRVVEQHVHEILKEFRINSCREFFLVKYDKIRAAIEKVIELSGAAVEPSQHP